MCTKNNKPQNLTRYAYDFLKEQIYNNNIKPGYLIKETSIAKQLGISRTPVREAIKMLEIEQVLEVQDGVGALVKNLSFKEVKDIFEVRKILEVTAVKTSIYLIPENKLIKLEKEFYNLLDKYENNINLKKDFINLDIEFHDLIISYSENDYLKTIYESICLKVRQFQYVSYSSLNNNKESILQHIALINLIKEQNSIELSKLLEYHIDWSLKALL